MAGKKYKADVYFVYENVRNVDEDANPAPLNLVQRLIDRLGEDFNTYSNASRVDTAFDPGRIQSMRENPDGMFEIQFLRLREATPAEIAKENGELELLHLDDGVFLAESASAIFDPLTNAFIKQRNGHGASTAFILAYLNSLLYDEAVGNLITFAPVSENTIDLGNVLRKTIRGFSAKVVYQGEALAMNNDMSAFNKYRPAVVDIAVKAKRGKAGQLNREEVARQIQVLKNSASTEKLSVTVLDMEDRAQTIDLLTDHIVLDFKVPDVDRHHPATHQVIYPALKGSYVRYVKENNLPIFAARRAWINEH